MSVNNVEGNISQASAGSDWFQNRKVNDSGKKEKRTLPIKEDNAVKISISREGMKSYQKKLAKQATSALAANNYGSELTRETEKLKGQRGNGGTYSLSNKAEDYVRAYGTLYDEIVHGYQNGTRERYVEDKTSETGYRKMTMEEELSGLDNAFQNVADRAEVEEMIAGEFKRLSSKAKSGETPLTDDNKKTETADKEIQETVGQKMKKLAQTWRDTYKISGSKENAMEKVLSVISSMFSAVNK